MIVRQAKALLVFFTGLLLLLVGADNILDYGPNFTFVQHVMTMDTVFPDTSLKWRAVTSPTLHHAAYLLIIAAELVSGGLCVAGAVLLWQKREMSAEKFNGAKDLAVAGLACAVALYLLAFLTIGGEWFEMWQSKTANAQASSFRFMALAALVLLFVNQPDRELS